MACREERRPIVALPFGCGLPRRSEAAKPKHWFSIIASILIKKQSQKYTSAYLEDLERVKTTLLFLSYALYTPIKTILEPTCAAPQCLFSPNQCIPRFATTPGRYQGVGDSGAAARDGWRGSSPQVDLAPHRSRQATPVRWFWGGYTSKCGKMRQLGCLLADNIPSPSFPTFCTVHASWAHRFLLCLFFMNENFPAFPSHDLVLDILMSCLLIFALIYKDNLGKGDAWVEFLSCYSSHVPMSLDFSV